MTCLSFTVIFVALLTTGFAASAADSDPSIHCYHRFSRLSEKRFDAGLQLPFGYFPTLDRYLAKCRQHFGKHDHAKLAGILRLNFPDADPKTREKIRRALLILGNNQQIADSRGDSDDGGDHAMD
jgi:hypothetical protein